MNPELLSQIDPIIRYGLCCGVTPIALFYLVAAKKNALFPFNGHNDGTMSPRQQARALRDAQEELVGINSAIKGHIAGENDYKRKAILEAQVENLTPYEK